jgi:hypothetical protein
VWAVLADTDAYPEWNPFLLVDGSFEKGNQLTIQTIFCGEGHTFTPEVLVARQPYEIVWLGTMGSRWSFAGQHHFELVRQTDATTLFKHFEDFSGMLSKPLYWYIARNTTKGFKAMNEALKKRVESRCVNR